MMSNLRDLYVSQKHQRINNWNQARLVFYRGPFLAGDLLYYRWFKTMLKVNDLHRKICYARTGIYHEAVAKSISFIISACIDIIGGALRNPDRTIVHQEMITPEIFRAMGLYPFIAEFLGTALTVIDPHSAERYIDICESAAIPGDLCSHNKSAMGLVLDDLFPSAAALVSSSMPCDGGMSSYLTIERHLKIPTIRLDVPHHFQNDKAVTYFAGELRRMITWLEENTPGKMDWDKLKSICENRNQMVAHELDLWDMMKVRPAPMAGDPVFTNHVFASSIIPGEKRSTEIFKDLKRLCEKNYTEGNGVIKNEKYRSIFWNPPLLHACDLFNWAERAYGIAFIIDSMTFSRRAPFIDTTSEESMLRGLGQNMMEGPMARHTRGPASNYIDDIFHLVKCFDIDMLWVAGNVGCKNTAALNGMLREKCRQNGLPVLIIDHDLSDPRTVSRESIMEQINRFMENTMQAQRLDL